MIRYFPKLCPIAALIIITIINKLKSVTVINKADGYYLGTTACVFQNVTIVNDYVVVAAAFPRVPIKVFSLCRFICAFLSDSVCYVWIKWCRNPRYFWCRTGLLSNAANCFPLEAATCYPANGTRCTVLICFKYDWRLLLPRQVDSRSCSSGFHT